MKLFKPQLQLAKESEEQANGDFRDHYYLHVVTLTDKSNYRADDYDIIDKLASDDLIHVKLYVNPDPDIIDLNYITPIVHTLDLGTPVERGTEFMVRVEVFIGQPSRDPGTGSAGSSDTGSSGAEEDDRPIGT